MHAPIVFEWTGEAMQPLPGFARKADAEFVIGERYMLAAHEQRSSKAHARYFAVVNELWQTLPDELREEYPSPEALRKRALIRAGYATMTDFVAANSREAAKAAAAMTAGDPYALVEIADRTVRIWRAESQSYRAMGKQRFNESVESVEREIAKIIGASVEDVRRAA